MKSRTQAQSDAFVVSFEAVTKRFDGIVAVSSVSLDVCRGEFVTLLGPSGCGKTTVLNLAAGFLAPDSGSISIAGQKVNDVPTYRRGIGMMFQNYALFPHMSVADNVAYGLRTRHVPKPERHKRVAEALALVKLKGMEDRRPRQLSGGQQQRVALARALVISPAVLLLDEPFSALDKGLRASMQIELRDIQRQLGLTTIFVTHDQSEALSMSDRVAVMCEGRIRQVGTPVDVYRTPVDPFVASFVGDSNRLRGALVTVDADDAVVGLGDAVVRVKGAGLAGLETGSPVDVFVRPEQLAFVAPGDSNAIIGRVVAHVYQGGHVDLEIECPAAIANRLLVRSSGDQALVRWPIGTCVAVSVQASGGVAFPAASSLEAGHLIADRQPHRPAP